MGLGRFQLMTYRTVRFPRKVVPEYNVLLPQSPTVSLAGWKESALDCDGFAGFLADVLGRRFQGVQYEGRRGRGD